MLDRLSPLKKNKKRVGRGGDHGGTSGRGHKGQKARARRGQRVQFEGGQTPLTRRLPKRGFNNKRFRVFTDIITFEHIEKLVSSFGVKEITFELLAIHGMIPKDSKRVKLLATGTLTSQVSISVHACSARAIELVKQLGGTVTLIEKIDDKKIIMDNNIQ